MIPPAVHLTVISMEWTPLFLLMWLMLLHRPTYLRAVAAALVLSVNAYTSLYMFLYCALIGGAIAAWMAVFQRPRLLVLTRAFVLRMAAFVGVTLLVSGPLIVALLLLSHHDSIMANHITSVFSMDPLSLVIPGSGWRFAALTHPYWQYVTTAGNIDEHSVFLGVAALFLLIYTAVRRRQLPQRNSLLMWALLMLIFAVLAMGPVIRLWGKQFDFPLMPYTILEQLLPPLRSSGVPVRINVLTVICVAVICGCGAAYLLREREGKRRFWRYTMFAMLVGIMALDYVPRPIPTFTMTVPPYVNALKALPAKGVVLDTIATDSEKILDQIVHEKPIAFGYVARITTSVQKDRVRLLKLIEDHDFVTICRDYRISYLVNAAETPAPQMQTARPTASMLTVSLVYHDPDVTIYELGCTVNP